MTYRIRRFRNWVLVAVLAGLCFGGSFTCKSGTDGDDDDGFSGSVNVR